jgi:TusA-related sulfurtransferase
MVKSMTTRNLDITGKVCPFCLLEVKKALDALRPSDELVVTCDHPPAATVTIPQFAQDTGITCKTTKVAPGLWELRLTKK